MNVNTSEQIRSLKPGECFVKHMLAEDLKDAEKARKSLLNSVRASTTRIGKDTGAVYTTTTLKAPIFDEEVLVAIVIKRVE